MKTETVTALFVTFPLTNFIKTSTTKPTRPKVVENDVSTSLL